MKKALFGAIAGVALMLGMGASHAQDFQPAIIYDLGGKFDKSFNEAAYNGAERFKEESGVEYMEFEVTNESQRDQALRRMARRGATIVVAVGFSYSTPLETIAAEFPDTKFTIIDSVVEQPNVQSVVFKEHEGSFLVGMAAALKSETGKVGFIGGMDIPLIRNFAHGYEQGVKYVNEGAEVFVNMTGTTPAAWNDPAKGAELAQSQFDRGADVVYAAAGGTGLGVLQTAADSGKFSIGVDSNQNYLHPGSVLTSMMKRVDVAVYSAFNGAMDDSWAAGAQSLGLAEEGVGYAVDEHNDPLITEDMKTQLEDAKARSSPANSKSPTTTPPNSLRGGLRILMSADAPSPARGPVTPGAASPPAIELGGVSKSFGAVKANRDIDLLIPEGSIHGIIGENGAGKSTLMNILYGFYRADSGVIRVDGEVVDIRTPEDAIEVGIGMVHQHFMLVEPFTVLENLLLGAEGGFTLGAGIEKARKEILELERDYGLEVDLDARVADLPVGVQQRVEILKALFRGARILILDEPTGVLTPQEADDLFRILDNLKAQGRTVVLITHKLREIMAATDNVSIMRQGQMVAHRKTSETSTEELAELMVGRRVLLRVDKDAARPGDTILSVRDLSVRDQAGVQRVKGVSFDVRAGEIVGIAGVAGNGQSFLLEALTGIRAFESGDVSIAGKPLAALPEGRPEQLGHVPEDRLRMGLVRGFAAHENAILGYQEEEAYCQKGFLERLDIIKITRDWMKSYDVRPDNPALKAGAFSGGNQQKLVLAREMEHDPALLVVGQPTRGVDIGAIEFIHKRLIAMRDAGKAVLLVSVELDEILSLADRILVMFDGVFTGELKAADADERKIGLLMAGVTGDAA